MITDILKDLIRIDTRASIGNESEAAAYLKKWCDRFNIDNEMVEPAKGKGSFIAHLPGCDKKSMALHID